MSGRACNTAAFLVLTAVGLLTAPGHADVRPVSASHETQSKRGKCHGKARLTGVETSP